MCAHSAKLEIEIDKGTEHSDFDLPKLDVAGSIPVV
jgi:hypothetical protein